MATLTKYNGYDYSSRNIILDYPEDLPAKTRMADTPGRDGVYTMAEPALITAPFLVPLEYIETGVLQARYINLSGHLIPQSGETLETLWKAFKAAHIPGRLCPLFINDDSRYLMTEVVSIKDVQAREYPGSKPWEVRFCAPSPLWVSATQTTATLANGVNAITTVAGNMPVAPTITLVVSGLGSSGTITLTLSNGVFSKALVIAAPPATTTLTIDFEAETITGTGSVDYTYLMSGVWWRLQPLTTQNLTITLGGGLTLSSRSIAWYDRDL